jgi:nitrite transporter
MKATIDTFTGVAVAKEDMIRNKFGQYWVLSMLAGMYIGFGILLIFTVGAQFASAGSVAVKMIMGISFGIALTLVVFAGAELFTGNNMVMLIGCLKGKTSWAWMAWLWFVCYFGNLAGAILLAWVMACTGLADGNVTGNFIGKVASAKMNAPWIELFCRGILCNALVCLAVWMSAKTKNETARVLLIFWCLFAFIACGFEHSIANMTIFGVSLFTAHPDTVSWGGFAYNQLPVTIGNIIGGGFFGLVYWFSTWSKGEQGTDGGLSVSLVDSTQGAIPGGHVIGEDENDNLIIGRLPRPSQQMVSQNQMFAGKEKSEKLADSSQQVITQSKLYDQKYVSTTDACVKELTQWCDQLSAILTHLRSRALVIDFDEFSEILIQLRLQRDNRGPIYIKDAQIRKLAEDMCPDFEKYARNKETVEFFSSYDIIPASASKGITEFLQLCSKVETTALKVMNPANYGINLSAAQSVLAEAVFELNEIRFELNGIFAVLSHA